MKKILILKKYQKYILYVEKNEQWMTYGKPSAHILTPYVTIPVDTSKSGHLYNVRVTAYNTHLPSGDYPGLCVFLSV